MITSYNNSFETKLQEYGQKKMMMMSFGHHSGLAKSDQMILRL
jgi:hypothetical protein